MNKFANIKCSKNLGPTGQQKLATIEENQPCYLPDTTGCSGHSLELFVTNPDFPENNPENLAAPRPADTKHPQQQIARFEYFC